MQRQELSQLDFPKISNLAQFPPKPIMTSTQLEKHKRVILYFDQKMSKADDEVYVAELRSRLMVNGGEAKNIILLV